MSYYRHRLERQRVILFAAHRLTRGALRTWTEYELTINAIDRILSDLWHNRGVSG